MYKRLFNEDKFLPLPRTSIRNQYFYLDTRYTTFLCNINMEWMEEWEESETTVFLLSFCVFFHLMCINFKAELAGTLGGY